MKKALREFRRVLKDEGVLYIDFKEGDGTHVKEKWDGKVEEYRVTEEEARELIKDAGFEIAEEQYPLWSMAVQRSINEIRRHKRDSEVDYRFDPKDVFLDW
jgi:hypothetical protein